MAKKKIKVIYVRLPEYPGVKSILQGNVLYMNLNYVDMAKKA